MEIFSSLILKTSVPGKPVLLADATLIMCSVRELLIVVKSVPSPLLNPTCAGIPPNPLTPPSVSPVVHCISLSAYRNIAYDSFPSVASTHWNVFV